jgi:hypothetical protein
MDVSVAVDRGILRELCRNDRGKAARQNETGIAAAIQREASPTQTHRRNNDALDDTLFPRCADSDHHFARSIHSSLLVAYRGENISMDRYLETEPRALG